MVDEESNNIWSHEGSIHRFTSGKKDPLKKYQAGI